MAGGTGERLSPYTREVPKPLVRLDGVPILEILLRQLRRAGFQRVTIAVWYKGDLIEQYFGDGRHLGLEIDYSRTDRSLGTAGPLAFVESLNAPFLVVNADLLTTLDFSDVADSHRKGQSAATLVVCTHTIEIGFGVVKMSKDLKIEAYVEKPRHSALIGGGILVLDPIALGYIQKGCYADTPEILTALLQDGRDVRAYRFEGEWHDIGTPEQLMRAEEAFRLDRARFLPDTPPSNQAEE